MKYRIEGVQRDAGDGVSIEIDANDVRDAEQKAAQLGIVVSSICDAAAVSRVTCAAPVTGAAQVVSAAQVVGAAPMAGVRRETAAPEVPFNGVPRPSGGFGIASVILGVVALMLCWSPLANVVALPLIGIGMLLALAGLIVGLKRIGDGVGLSIGGGAICATAVLVAVITIEPPLAADAGDAATTDVAAVGLRTEGTVNMRRRSRSSAPPPVECAGDETAILSDVIVRIEDVRIGRVRYADSKGTERVTQDKLFAVRVVIENSSAHFRKQFGSWNGRMSSTAMLADSHGNEYRGGRHSTQSSRGGDRTFDPGVKLTDTIYFEVPVKDWGRLTLNLPGSHFGARGSIRFQIDPEQIAYD